MSDSVKKYHELVKDGIINPDTKIKSPKKAFRILVEYDIEDIKEAVEIYENNLKQLFFRKKLVILYYGCKLTLGA